MLDAVATPFERLLKWLARNGQEEKAMRSEAAAEVVLLVALLAARSRTTTGVVGCMYILVKLYSGYLVSH